MGPISRLITLTRVRLLALTLVVLALVPGLAGAQSPPRPIEPSPPPPCLDCWWPVAPVAVLERLEARVTVTDGVIATSYRLHLTNPNRPFDLMQPGPGAEARIVVPVPAGASVTDLLLLGGPETLEGRVLDPEQALRIYEQIVRRQIDPALLRSLGDDLYEVRAFPIPPGEQRELRFTVTSPLLADGDQVLIEVPWARMSPLPASASLSVDVDVPWEVRSAFAPGLDIEIDRESGDGMRIDWESPDGWTPRGSLRLYLTGGAGLVDTRLLSYRLANEDGYFALLLAPQVEVDRAVERDIVLVLDTSGSMSGSKIEQAKSAAAFVLGRLNDGDRFAIVSFSRNVRVFGEGLHPDGDADLGIAFVERLIAAGGTNISGALDRALSLLGGDRPASVIFLTDGLPTAGITQVAGILDLTERVAPRRVQLFAFGVGYDVDTVLLDALTTQLTGTSHYVAPDERIDVEVSRLFERISTPVLTDVEVEIEGIETFDIAPAQVRGIFAGSQALITGRYEGSGEATVIVRGNSTDGAERLTYRVSFPRRDTADPAIAQIWAQRRVADLLTELRIEGPREALLEQIVEIATRFGIVTPYTAYLAEEPELRLTPQAARESLDSAAAAPSSGASAVAGASALEDLRSGAFDSGAEAIRIAGSYSYYYADGVWARSDFDPAGETVEVTVGSAEFAALIEQDADIASAAALGERVIVLGPQGWVTIVWPAVESVDPPAVLPQVVSAVTGSGTRSGGGQQIPPASGVETPDGAADGEGAGGALMLGLGLVSLVVVAGLGGYSYRRLRAVS